MPTQNLGQVGAVYIGSTAPTNTNLLWRDTSVTPNLWKEYNTQTSQWELVGNVGGSIVYDLGFFISDEATPVTTDNIGHIYTERAQTISSIALTAKTAPTGSALIVNVLKNGVTILTSNISLPAGSNRVSITSPQISDLNIAVGDKMSAEVIAPGLTIKGAGVSVTIVSELT